MYAHDLTVREVKGASPNRGEQPFDAPFDHVRSPLGSDLLPVRWTLGDLLRAVDEAAKHDRVEAPEPENTREPRFAKIRCAVYRRVLVGADLMTDGVDTIGRDDTLDVELIKGCCAAARGVNDRGFLRLMTSRGVMYRPLARPSSDVVGPPVGPLLEPTRLITGGVSSCSPRRSPPGPGSRRASPLPRP